MVEERFAYFQSILESDGVGYRGDPEERVRHKELMQGLKGLIAYLLK